MLAGLLCPVATWSPAALAQQPGPAALPEPPPAPEALLQRHLETSRAQLERLSRQTLELAAQVAETQSALEASEQRNRLQSARIEELERRLAELPPADPAEPLRATLLATLAETLPPSPVYGIVDQHLLVAADPVFVFGKALLGAEGRDRLAPLATALAAALQQLPADHKWRLRVEGHTDVRPLRANRHFASNWELSAARAVAMVRYLEEFGIPAERLSAVALAANRPLDPGDSSAAHRRNRRLELHLVSD